jgi:hypothetical protein
MPKRQRGPAPRLEQAGPLPGAVAWHYDRDTGVAWVKLDFGDHTSWILPADQARDIARHILRAADNAEAEGRGEAPKYPPGVGRA